MWHWSHPFINAQVWVCTAETTAGKTCLVDNGLNNIKNAKECQLDIDTTPLKNLDKFCGRWYIITIVYYGLIFKLIISLKIYI